MSMDRNPLRNLERQFEQLRQQFEEMVNRWDGEQFDVPQSGIATGGIGVDLADRGDKFILTADVPGFESEDIDLRLSDETLHITAEHEQAEREEGDERYIKSERTRRMHRSIRLPEPVDEDAVEAKYENGVLTITLPKTEPGELDGETIEIRTEESE
ncbi:Hsp20/alpha crystallin family protein [Haloarchaeobius amylolyticus]|uniref:Hsp20/alpha crystallin family protein n=1 Tax=Haloarchaeobius amylolyticus TaxID=1198296 RepID=A0ABD6BDB9_9EURY